VKTPLTRIREGSYRHEPLGVKIEKTSTADFPWELNGPDPDGSGVVLARTLGDARAFLHEIAERLNLQPDTLLALHRYLFPERYEDVAVYEWHVGTIEDVAAMLEEALVNDPRAELSPK
jgi:hypothetical protein